MPKNNYSEFGHDFQVNVLSMLVQDPMVFPKYSDVVSPDYFDDPSLASICRSIIEYYKNYNSMPTQVALKVFIDNDLPNQINVSERQRILSLLDIIYSRDNSGNFQYVLDKIIEFGSLQALKNAVYNIVDDIKSGDEYDPQRLRQYLEKALAVGSDRNCGLNFFKESLNISEYIKSSSIYSLDKKIRTGFPSIDGAVNGLSPGEFGVLVGTKNIGKSTILTNLGYQALLQGKNVLHVTCELKEVDVAIKYAALMSNHTTLEIIQNSDKYLQSISIPGVGKDALIIKYFSPSTLTPSMFRSFLSRLRGDGIKPDMIILDYLKQLKCQRDHNGYGELVDQIIGILDDFDVAIWTAHQGNRSTWRKENVTVSDIGDSWQIIEKADVAISLSQTQEEKQVGVFKMNLDCARRGKDTLKEIMCNIDYSRAFVTESPSTPEMPDFSVDV